MNKLKELRKSKGMTQPELAELTGVSLKALQAYEQDYRPIDRASAEDVYRLAKTLGTTIEDLLGVESLTSDNQNARPKSEPIIDRDLYERAQAKLLEKKENAYIPPLGYKEQDGKLVVNEEEAEVVKRAFSEMSRDGRVSLETEKELRRLWSLHYEAKRAENLPKVEQMPTGHEKWKENHPHKDEEVKK